jgi:putative Mn2+ efflux pump MntP
MPVIPYISLALLCYIGGKMLYEGLKPCECEGENDSECDCAKLTIGALLLQGLATSIDALSVGFTIADLNFPMALLESAIIAVVTFGICIGGIIIGKTFGTKLSNKASILGGVILIAIGFEIFISSFF